MHSDNRAGRAACVALSPQKRGGRPSSLTLWASIFDRAGLRDASWRRFVARWLAVSLALIVVAAFQSDGFHHPDEYFQTIEFAGAKLGRTPPKDLPWEYSARMRSWSQPALYVLEARALGTIGADDPFSWARAFRLTSGLLGWLAIAGLVLNLWRWLPEAAARQAAVRTLALAWFVPYLAVRTSSESLAGSCLALAVSLLALGFADRPSGSASPPALVMAGVGLLLGLAFELRFAVGVAALGVLAWSMAVARVRAGGMAWAGCGLAAALALGAVADRWGYGAWAFPPYEYALQNLVLGRAAQQFGTQPWYGYLILAAMGVAAPLVVLVIAGAALGCVRNRFHVLTWASVPFFLVHCLIAHKELRFLFPLAAFAPVLLVLGVAPSENARHGLLARLWDARRRMVGRALTALNLLALAAFTLVPTRPQLGFQRFVREHYPDRFNAYLLGAASPWTGQGLRMHFFRPASLRLEPVASLDDIERRGLPAFLVVTDSCTPLEPHSYACVPLYRSLPCALHELTGNRTRRIPAWDLYRCKELH